jgi:hypothetical protein
MRRDLVGVLAFVIFLTLLVFMMNKISAPDARYELGDYVIIADLVLAFVFLMVPWGAIMHGERFENVLPFRVPSYVGIPLGVAAFVFLYVSGLGELLLHVNEVESPALALAVAALILAGATYLSTRPDKPATPHQTYPGTESAPAEADHQETPSTLSGGQH